MFLEICNFHFYKILAYDLIFTDRATHHVIVIDLFEHLVVSVFEV